MRGERAVLGHENGRLHDNRLAERSHTVHRLRVLGGCLNGTWKVKRVSVPLVLVLYKLLNLDPDLSHEHLGVDVLNGSRLPRPLHCSPLSHETEWQLVPCDQAVCLSPDHFNTQAFLGLQPAGQSLRAEEADTR